MCGMQPKECYWEIGLNVHITKHIPFDWILGIFLADIVAHMQNEVC